MTAAQDTKQPVAIRESKIVATERLRREGRWEEASAYRDQERKRLRAGGMSRKEANEEAWRLMCDKFRPLDESLFWLCYVVAEVPPRLCLEQSEPDTPDFADVWRTFCRLAGCCCFVDPRLVDLSALESLLKDRMQYEPAPDESKIRPSEAREALLELAFTEPIEFWELVEETFIAALKQMGGSDPHTEATKQELRFYLSKLPALEDACEDVLAIWSGLLSPQNQKAEQMICVAQNPRFIGSDMAA